MEQVLELSPEAVFDFILLTSIDFFSFFSIEVGKN
jgi:hypothetical protein